MSVYRPTIREAFAALSLIKRFLLQRVGKKEYYWSSDFAYSVHVMSIWDDIQGFKAQREYYRVRQCKHIGNGKRIRNFEFCKKCGSLFNPTGMGWYDGKLVDLKKQEK